MTQMDFATRRCTRRVLERTWLSEVTRSASKVILLAGGPGFEPRVAESESAVLPLRARNTWPRRSRGSARNAAAARLAATNTSCSCVLHRATGTRRNRDDALAGLSGGWDAYRSNSLRRRLGFGEGSCIRSSQDRLEERQGTGRRNESTS
jgi:hypothetical protein